MRLVSIFSLVVLIQTSLGYKLQTNYSGTTFFDKFDYYSKSDPTSGFVQYQNATSAHSMGLVYTQGNRVIIKADNSTVTPNGRPSVRITSKEIYNSGIFIFDVNHVPTGFGTWPAFWLAGQSLNANGEIDIVEGINNSTTNTFSAYPSDQCRKVTQKRAISATTNEISKSKSIKKRAFSANSFGTMLDNHGGGVFITQWENSTGIQTWFFPRNAIPDDIKSGNLTPNAWGKPYGSLSFNTGCSTPYFSNLKIIINLTFCGNWADSADAWSRTGISSNCSSYVKNNPSSFNDAYWDINSIKVYQS